MEGLQTYSVADFLQSNSFNNGVILLEHDSPTEADTRAAVSSTPTNNGVSSTGDKLKRHQVAENAVRVSLLLTRAFVDYGPENMATDVQLKDFFVTTKPLSRARSEPPPSHSAARSNRPVPVFSSKSNVSTKKTSNGNGFNGQQLQTSFGFFSQFDAVTYQELFKQTGNTNPQNIGSGGIERNDGAIDFDDGCEEEKKSCGAVPDKLDVDIILGGIKVLFPTRVSDTQRQQQRENPMQTLGKLLFSILGGPPSCDSILEAESSRREMTDGIPSSKTSRAEVSLFSNLIDNEGYPASLCRLLADMVDTGPNGRADSPYESFQEVIQDLEQMVAEPSVYLHDLDCPGGQSPIFGQRYYGRVDEVSNILRLSSLLEESLQKSYVGYPKFSTEAVLVSGSAGSGKSHLVQTTSDFLKSLGWIVIKSKFERDKEHTSRLILSGMFDEVIAYLVKLKEGDNTSVEDMAYWKRATKAILTSIGIDSMSLLADFLPSLQRLFDLKKRSHNTEMPGWQLIYSLTKTLEAILDSDRFIMICCDDLQWSDKSSLEMVKSVISNLGGLKKTSRRLLFVGLYRNEEVDDSHPFSVQYKSLKKSSDVNTTEIKLSGLTRKDVEDMIMTELKLPRRYVVELASVVHKKTNQGHAIFVVELLNSLLRDSVITYSARKRCYSWDASRIDILETGDGVASLIASNLSSLPLSSQRALRVLACFGIQTDIDLIKILEGYEAGIISSLDGLIENGILDQAGPIIMFAHDLIQLEVYQSIPMAQRKLLHLELGEFLGSMAKIEVTSDMDVLRMDQLNLNDTFYAGRSMSSTLISLACDQINTVGPESVEGEDQRKKFIKWNLSSGQKSYHMSDFGAALFYFSRGIDFIGEEHWYEDTQNSHYRMCLQLHEGAVLASYELGEGVARYAAVVLKECPFKDSLVVETVLLKTTSLKEGKHDECINKGLEILRKLELDIAHSPSIQQVMMAMGSTNNVAAAYDLEGVMKLCDKKVDESTHNIIKISDAFYISVLVRNSPYLPLVACEIVKHSLQNGVCPESSTAFASYAVFKILLEGDFATSLKWATVARAITEKDKSRRSTSTLKTNIILYASYDVWFATPRDISQQLLSDYNNAMQSGEIDCALICLHLRWKMLILGGEKLSFIKMDQLKQMDKHAPYMAKYATLDLILLMQLTGVSQETIYDKEDIRAEATSTNDPRLLYQVHMSDFLRAFWKRDYVEAEEYSRNALGCPPSQVLLIYHTFFRGLVAFQLYRTLGGDSRLEEGIETKAKVEKWAQNSMRVFESKLLLLKAEHASTISKNNDAESLYKKSIEISRGQGCVHEMALSYELLGGFYAARDREADSKASYCKAHAYYVQWGALAVAETIAKDHGLDESDLVETVETENTKHSRQWN